MSKAEEKDLQTIKDFAKRASKQKTIPSEIQQVIDEHFWEMI